MKLEIIFKLTDQCKGESNVCTNFTLQKQAYMTFIEYNKEFGIVFYYPISIEKLPIFMPVWIVYLKVTLSLFGALWKIMIIE